MDDPNIGPLVYPSVDMHVVNGGHAPSMEHIAGQDPIVPHLKELNGDKARTHDEVFPPRYGEAGQKHQTESKNGKARSFS